MRSSRVIRPARVLEDSFQVLVPCPSTSEPEGECGGESEVARGALERERELQVELQARERQWEEREEAHAEELRRAEARASEEIGKAVERFTSIVDDFMAQREDLLKSSEETVVRLAVAIARRIVGEAVEVNDEIVLEAIRRALKHVVDKENVAVRVNPRDLKIVREHRSDWLGIVEGTRSLEIEEDERIHPGGCLVETEGGNVEAQIGKQIQTLEKALVERVR